MAFIKGINRIKITKGENLRISKHACIAELT